MKKAKISVCIASFNGAKYIKEQLESILSQLKPDDEVIISDDGSSDETLNIIKKLSDKRIRIFKHEKNQQLKKKYLSSFYFSSYNFENAIKHATGDIVYLSDQDDIWDKDRISKTLPYLEKYDFLMCNYAIMNMNGEITNEKYLQSNPIGKTLFWNLWKIPFRGCCMSFRREALFKALPFPKNCINHDIWIGLILVHKGYKCKFVDIPLHYYRSHTTNVSSVVGKSPNPLWFKIAYRLRFLYQVITF